MNFATCAYHDNLASRTCHKRSNPHPLDMILFVTHCQCADHVIQSFIISWPVPLNQVARLVVNLLSSR